MFKKNIKDRPLDWGEYWHTDVGAWFPGERVVMHGHNILSEMKGCRWMEMILFAVKGKRPEKRQVDFLDAVLALSGCIPDPRLWNNRIAALAGTARSTPVMGISGGMAISDAVIFGFQPMLAAFNMFKSMLVQLEAGECLETLIVDRLSKRAGKFGRPGKGKRRSTDRMAGFGRPVASGDERVAPLMEVAAKYGYDQAPAVSVAFAVEEYLLQNNYKLKLNTGGLIAAFCVDQGLTAKQYYHYISHCFCVSLLACNADTANQPEGSFFPLRCEQIDYKGENERKWL